VTTIEASAILETRPPSQCDLNLSKLPILSDISRAILFGQRGGCANKTPPAEQIPHLLEAYIILQIRIEFRNGIQTKIN
jgi:hypothetical protein